MSEMILLNARKVDATSFPYIYEENVTIVLKGDKGIVRCNIYRPKDDTEKYPGLVTYGPYGKDVHYRVYVIQTSPPSFSLLTFLQLSCRILR